MLDVRFGALRRTLVLDPDDYVPVRASVEVRLDQPEAVHADLHVLQLRADTSPCVQKPTLGLFRGRPCVSGIDRMAATDEPMKAVRTGEGEEEALVPLRTRVLAERLQ